MNERESIWITCWKVDYRSNQIYLDFVTRRFL